MFCKFVCLFVFLLSINVGASGSLQSQPAAPPQAATGTIKGQVTDPSGAPVANAEVQASLPPDRLYTAKSDASGTFVLEGLPAGHYVVRGSAPGFITAEIQIALDDPAAAGIPAEITIKLQLSFIISTCCELSCGYDAGFRIPFVDLPLADRSPTALIALGAGVTTHRDNFSINGRRTTDSSVSFAGLDVRDPATGGAVASIGLDALQEFTYANNFEQDRTYEPQKNDISVVSRAGSNTYRGTALWHLERPGFAANNFFTNRAGTLSDQSSFDLFGGTFGGPLLRDKVFLFGSYESTRDWRITGSQIVAPLSSFLERTAAVQGPLFRSLYSAGRIVASRGLLGGLVDLDKDGLPDIGDELVPAISSSRHDLAMGRVDVQVGSRLRISGLFNGNNSTSADESAGGLFLAASPLGASGRGRVSSVDLTFTINPTTITTLQLGYVQRRASTSGAGSELPLVIAVNSPISTGDGIAEAPEHRTFRSLSLDNEWVQVRGVHTLSGGFKTARRSADRVNEGLENGRIFYSDVLALVTDGKLSFIDPSHSIVRADVAEEAENRQYVARDWYAHAGDNLRVTPKLTLDLGLTYSLYSGTVYEVDSDTNNVGYSASFAYAPLDKLTIRGGAATNYAAPSDLPYGEVIATPFYPRLAAPGLTSFSNRELAGLNDMTEIESRFSTKFQVARINSAFLSLQQVFGRVIIDATYRNTRGSNLLQVYRDRFPDGDGVEGQNTLVFGSAGRSSYNALQIRVTGRERRGLLFQAHYTVSKSIDSASDGLPSMFRWLTLGPVHSENVRAERGLSDFDRRQRLVGLARWRLPELASATVLRRSLMGGWRVSTIVTVQSGPHVPVYSGGDNVGGLGDFNGDGVFNDRLAYVGSMSLGSAMRGSNPAESYFARELFASPGTDGRVELGRNVLPSPGYAAVDLSLEKRFPIASNGQYIELRADIFNIANRTNFDPPVTDAVSSAFGRSVSASAPRTVRVALRVTF